jgi:hypothetical protein
MNGKKFSNYKVVNKLFITLLLIFVIISSSLIFISYIEKNNNTSTNSSSSSTFDNNSININEIDISKHEKNKGIRWWFDINVYIVNKSKNYPYYYDFEPAFNATVILFTPNSTGLEFLGVWQAKGNAFNNKATAHVEFYVKEPRTDYSFDIFIYGISELNVAITENDGIRNTTIKKFWNGLAFTVYTNWTKAGIFPNEYFRRLNEAELNAILGKRATDNININLKIKELLMRYDIKVFIDEHNINLYLIYPWDYQGSKRDFIPMHNHIGNSNINFISSFQHDSIFYVCYKAERKVHKVLGYLQNLYLAEVHAIENSQVFTKLAYYKGTFEVGMDVSAEASAGIGFSVETKKSWGLENFFGIGIEFWTGSNKVKYVALRWLPLVYELWHIKLKWLNYEWNHFTHFTYVDVRQNPAIVADFGGIFSEHKGDPLTIGASRVKLDNATYPRYSEVYAKSMTIYYEQYTISYVVSFEAEIGGNVSLISATVTVKSNYETKVEYELFHQAYYYDISYTKNKYIYITNMPTNITFPITLQTPLCSFNDDVIIYEQRTILVSPAIWMFLFWYISDKPLSDR